MCALRLSPPGIEANAETSPRLLRTGARDQAFLISSHRKNGPPMSAVMTPTGSSTGARIVRATTSQPTRNAAPKSADAGSTTR